jgi:hypothetical protein
MLFFSAITITIGIFWMVPWPKSNSERVLTMIGALLVFMGLMSIGKG